MKTKDLIRELQEADPFGEMECCVQNSDIHFVDLEPAYYDGYLQVLKRSDSKYYNIIGAKYTSQGSKVVIHPLSISDAIFEQEDLPVEFEDLSPGNAEYYRQHVEKRRKETREINDDVELSFFNGYLIKRLVNYGEDFSEEAVRQAAKEFYEENMSYLDAMPKDIAQKGMPVDGQPGLSFYQRRCLQWDQEIAVDFEDGKLKLRKV